MESSCPHIKTGMGRAIEDKDGFVKFLVGMKDRNHEVLTIMRPKNNVIYNILHTIHIHPSPSEAIEGEHAAPKKKAIPMQTNSFPFLLHTCKPKA